MAYREKSICRLVPTTDYVQARCGKCGAVGTLDYLGLDPSMVLLKFSCPKCGDLGTWKLQDAGHGFYEQTK